MAARTQVTFLGTAAVIPGGGHDTASFLINGKYLVDTGWYAAIKMCGYGFEPTRLEVLFLTHCHHDHYLGLPHLLFYLRMRPGDRPPLKIAGPAGDLERVVTLSRQLLQPDRFPQVDYQPELLPLQPGDAIETDAFHVTTCACLHPVPALCYRFVDKQTGRIVAFTGDTAPHAALVEHVRGADLLITEASFGPKPAPETNPSLHSGAPDAARLATAAGVRRLALVHCPDELQSDALAAARAIFPATFWPEDGETVTVGAPAG
jgi:ribonuclease Z